MNLQELNELRELNEIDLFYKIVDTIESTKGDLEKSLRGQIHPGVRVRKKMLDIKLFCDIIRDKIQIRNKGGLSEKRTFALDKAIEKEEEKESRDAEYIEKLKQERIARLGNYRN